VVARDYEVEERMTIDVSVMVDGEVTTRGWALNEASVEKGSRQRMLEVVIEVDDRPLSRWGCDGVVFATPTGSTAYAFSAGGPVVWPEVDALLLVPISAHALFARPLVMYRGNRARIRFVQGGIVNHQQTARAIDKQFGLLPQRRGIRREPLQEATDAFMRGPMRRIRLHTGGFGTRDHVRCGDQKRDVIEIGHFGCIHARMVAHNASTA